MLCFACQAKKNANSKQAFGADTSNHIYKQHNKVGRASKDLLEQQGWLFNATHIAQAKEKSKQASKLIVLTCKRGCAQPRIQHYTIATTHKPSQTFDRGVAVLSHASAQRHFNNSTSHKSSQTFDRGVAVLNYAYSTTPFQQQHKVANRAGEQQWQVNRDNMQIPTKQIAKWYYRMNEPKFNTDMLVCYCVLCLWGFTWSDCKSQLNGAGYECRHLAVSVIVPYVEARSSVPSLNPNRSTQEHTLLTMTTFNAVKQSLIRLLPARPEQDTAHLACIATSLVLCSITPPALDQDQCVRNLRVVVCGLRSVRRLSVIARHLRVIVRHLRLVCRLRLVCCLHVVRCLHVVGCLRVAVAVQKLVHQHRQRQQDVHSSVDHPRSTSQI